MCPVIPDDTIFLRIMWKGTWYSWQIVILRNVVLHTYLWLETLYYSMFKANKLYCIVLYCIVCVSCGLCFWEGVRVGIKPLYSWYTCIYIYIYIYILYLAFYEDSAQIQWNIFCMVWCVQVTWDQVT